MNDGKLTARVFEMTAVDVARSLVAWAEHDHPGNDWWGVQIARRHVEGLLAEIDRLRAHDHSAVDGCRACALAEAFRV